MRLLRSFLTLSLSFSILCLSFANSYSEEIWWNDYREPLSNVRVIHDESATINVDIPENFIANKEEITLVVTVKSNVYVGEALKREKGFHLFYPSITVNDKLFGTHRIYVTELPEVQTNQINIKTKRLKSGKNKFKAKYNWRQQGNYCVGRCSYTIKEISFRDSPPLLYNLTVSSIPAEADIYLDGKYYAKTPKKLEVGKGWHNIKIEKAGYQISLDDIKVLEDDEYFIELERKKEQPDMRIVPEVDHFVKYENDIIYDTNTDLEWYVGPDTDMTWIEAKEWVNNLTLDSGGWRMPTGTELSTLYQKGKGTRNISPLFKTTGWWIWTNWGYEGRRSQGFSLDHGFEDWEAPDMSSTSRAFAVRSR